MEISYLVNYIATTDDPDCLSPIEALLAVEPIGTVHRVLWVMGDEGETRCEMGFTYQNVFNPDPQAWKLRYGLQAEISCPTCLADQKRI